jgi:Protein of unknown function (DUF2848)
MMQFLCLGLQQVKTVEFSPNYAIIAGWTGRNLEAIEHHIEELAAIGVPRPSTVPLYYRVSTNALVQTQSIQVVGENTSGEVEPVLIAMKDGLWLTVGSDHTDRSAETYSVGLSKQLCAKVIADQAWRFDEVKDHLDSIAIRSWIVEITPPKGSVGEIRVPYQEGTLAAMRPLPDLISGFKGQAVLEVGNVMSCGTVGVIHNTGGIRPAKQFVMQMHDPVLNRTIDWRYKVECLPLVS